MCGLLKKRFFILLDIYKVFTVIYCRLDIYVYFNQSKLDKINEYEIKKNWGIFFINSIVCLWYTKMIPLFKFYFIIKLFNFK